GTLVVFFVFFLLASDDLFKRKLVKLAGPSLEKKKVTVQILAEIDRQIEKFLLVRIVLHAEPAEGQPRGDGHHGVQHDAIWGIAAGVLNTIPYFGSIVVAASAAVASFLQFGTIEMAIAV